MDEDALSSWGFLRGCLSQGTISGVVVASVVVVSVVAVVCCCSSCCCSARYIDIQSFFLLQFLDGFGVFVAGSGASKQLLLL